MKPAKKRLKGFTLVEMIVVVALFTMMMACVFSILTPIQKVYKDTYEFSDAQSVTDIAVRYVEDEVRYANRLFLYDHVDRKDNAAAEDFIRTVINGSGTEESIKNSMRGTYYFNRPGITRVSGSTDNEDIIYVLRISNPQDDSDLTSRGKISRWVCKKGVVNSVDDFREWAVNEGIYDDNAHNCHYTFDFRLGVWDYESGTTKAVTPNDFAMELKLYRSKNTDTQLNDAYYEQTVAFALTNIAANGAIKNEKIKFNNTIASTTSEIEVPRYKYNDVGAGSDVYFFYTKVPKIEDIH